MVIPSSPQPTSNLGTELLSSGLQLIKMASLPIMVLLVLGSILLRHDITLALEANQLYQQSDQYQQVLSGIFSNQTSNQALATTSAHLADSLETINQTLPHTLILKRLPLANQPELTFWLHKAPRLLNVLSDVSANSNRIVIMFQNDHELRATGGFMGSFADVSFLHNAPISWEIYDIYEPTGQFPGYVEPPPGVEEFLSGGEGLKLPDANWHPDFPSSARDILHFLALGGWEDVDVVMAVTTGSIADLLSVTGPIYVPDYDVTVTATNMHQVLRADRAQFFPGSKAKSNLLNSLAVQLQLKLDQLTPDQLLEILAITEKNWQAGNIKAFSPQEALQAQFVQLGIDGSLPKPDQASLLIYPVESNVGINKANHQVARTHHLQLGEYRSLLTTTFTNSNQRTETDIENLDYINYHRLIVYPETEISQITSNQQDLDDWSERIITTATGYRYKEIGFLVEVAEQSTTTLTIQLTHPPIGSGRELLLPLQPGLPVTPITITEPTGQTTTQ